MLRNLATFLVALGGVSLVIAADETAGRILPAPVQRALTIESATATVAGGKATVRMQLKKHAAGSARLSWRIPDFQWVTMDADDRDPSFSDIQVFADAKEVAVSRLSKAFIGSLDITAKLRASKVDIDHISLGNIDELPNSGAGGIERTNPVYAYFRDIDGKLFPAWQTRALVWADLSSATRSLSYTYTLRPTFFLVADQPDAAADRIAKHCKLDSSSRARLLSSLKKANLVCLYQLPLPRFDGPKTVEWQSRADSDDAYICTAARDDMAQISPGVSLRKREQQVDVHTIAITKDNHCGN